MARREEVPWVLMAINPPTGTAYKPDALASGGALEKPFQEANVPRTGSIVPTLLRLALRRLPGMGYSTQQGTSGVKTQKDAFTMGSHGSLK
jgi:hypothetical protein